MKLNLGCGPELRDGWVNVDRVPGPGVDVVHDVDVHPWPWPDCSAGTVYAKDLFEHIDDPVGFMAQAHRVLVPNGGRLRLITPMFNHLDSYTDPTHKRHCTPYTWDYWIPGTALHASYNAFYGGVGFELVDRTLTEAKIDITLRRVG